MGVLGVDTSCYRTSVAFADERGIVSNRRKLLAVKMGDRGLRQSEGLFQHVQNLPALIPALKEDIAFSPIDAVCVSTRPRPVEGSYMPVFTAGEGFARSYACLAGVPLIETSHQQGHIRAAMEGLSMPGGDFLAVHMSGGTTEVLRCSEDLSIALLGGSKDLHAGQLVDRVGVRLGMAFPAGPEMERLARRGHAKSLLPTSVDGISCNLSGAEAQLNRLLDGGMRAEDAAAEVYSFLARTLSKMLDNASKQTGLRHALLAGGVCASDILKEQMADRLKRLGSDLETYWAAPELSGDNAAGVALIGWDQLHKGGGAL